MADYTSSISRSTISQYSNLFFLNLQPSLMMSLLSYFHVAPRVLPDPAGPLSAELSPSAITEANAAVNGMQQAKTKESKKRGTYIGLAPEIDHAEDHEHLLHARKNGTRYLGMACSFESSTPPSW